MTVRQPQDNPGQRELAVEIGAAWWDEADLELLERIELQRDEAHDGEMRGCFE